VGVKEATLQAHGAVSEETAREMAEGGAKAANADAALSVTGIAGPGGGTKEKPVGLVYIGCYVNGKTIVKKNLFTGNRRKVREQAVETALKLLLECLP
jgi:PncC family amidohydrolase